MHPFTLLLKIYPRMNDFHMYSKFTADALLSTEPSLSSAGKSAMHMFFHQEDEKKLFTNIQNQKTLKGILMIFANYLSLKLT